MAKKNKDRRREKRQQERKAQKERKRADKARKPTDARATGKHLPDRPLVPPRPDRLGPAVHVDATGTVVPDPYVTLGLEPGVTDEAAVRQAWRRELERHPPESDPEGARVVREARDRLLEPARFLEREVGVLHAPDADAWGLPDSAVEAAPARLAAADRLIGQAVLYALVEDALGSR